MIESPKNFIEQFQNFIEHIAGLMKTFLTKEVADNYYLGKTDKAVSANTADTAGIATKATQDANGNVIPDTYATKAELTKDVQQLQTGLATLEANAVKSVNNTLPVAGNVTLDLTKYENRWTRPNAESSSGMGITFPYTAERDGVWYVKRNNNSGTVIPRINGMFTTDMDAFSIVSLPFKKGDVLSFDGNPLGKTIIFNETD